MAKYIGNDARYGVFETQTIIPDGINSEYTLLYQIGSASSIIVNIYGTVQEPYKAYNISEGGRKIVFTFVPDAVGDNPITIVYLGRELAVPVTQGGYPIRVRETGTGAQTDFDLSGVLTDHGAIREEGLLIFIDNVQQSFGDDFTLDVLPDLKSGSVVKFVSPPGNGSIIDFYIHSLERTDISTIPDKTLTGNKFVDNVTIGSPTNPISSLYTNNIFVTNNPIAQYDVGVLNVKSHTGYANSEFTVITNAISTSSIAPVNLFSVPVPDNGACWFSAKVIAIDLDNGPGSNKTKFVFLRGGVRKNQGEAPELFDLSFDHSGEEGSPGYNVTADVDSTNLLIRVFGDGDSTHWAGTLERQCITFNNLLIEAPSANNGETFGGHTVNLFQQYIDVNPVQIGETFGDHVVGNQVLGPSGNITSDEIVSAGLQINQEVSISNGIDSQEQFGSTITIMTT